MVAGISSDADPNKLFQGGGESGSARDLLQVPRFVPLHPRRRRRTAIRMERARARGDDIARVRARAHAATIDVLGPVSDPRTIHKSTFSIGFVLAMIAKKGSVEVDDFTEEALGTRSCAGPSRRPRWSWTPRSTQRTRGVGSGSWR
jgi:hypothetical protein